MSFAMKVLWLTIFGHGVTKRIFVLVLMHPLIFLALIEQTTAHARWISSLPAPSCPGSSNTGNNSGSHFSSVVGQACRSVEGHLRSRPPLMRNASPAWIVPPQRFRAVR